MGTRLVTIATFDQPEKARLAENVLADAGIRAAVTDESVVAMDWLLGNAVGWVKLQVLEEDAERAVAVLELELPPDGDRPDVDPDRFAAEAEAAPPEDGPDPSPPPIAPAAGEVRPADTREDYARRLFFAAWFGLVVPPVWFFAVYLLLNATFGSGELSARGRYNLFVGGLVTLLGLPMAYFFFLLLGGL